jgi:hypothetical protein
MRRSELADRKGSKFGHQEIVDDFAVALIGSWRYFFLDGHQPGTQPIANGHARCINMLPGIERAKQSAQFFFRVAAAAPHRCGCYPPTALAGSVPKL